MTKALITYIGTSKTKEIRREGSVVSYDWGTKEKWTKFKTPVADSKKKIKYNKNTKNKAGSSKYGGAGGVTVLGTTIPATKTVVIDGVQTTVDVRYYQRGYTIYTRTSALKNANKMSKTVYTKNKPYQYRLQLKDKVKTKATYSEYADGIDYIYFADFYIDDQGTRQTTSGHLAHPSKYSLSYSDVNFSQNTSDANNSQERDNYGKYILQKVRSNVVSLSLAWTGLSEDEGADLLDTLNPDNDHPYLIVQYYDPKTKTYQNGTFYASERTVEQYANGFFSSIAVTLTEV